MLSRIASRGFRLTPHLFENGLSAACSARGAEISTSSSLGRTRRNGDDGRHRQSLLREVQELENEDPGYLESLENIEEVLGSTLSLSSGSAELRRKAEQQFRRQTRERIQAQNLAQLDVQDGNLLTWSAKRQIIELATQDPLLWTPQTLSARFPATPQQIAKLLKKKNFLPKTPEKIFFHDRVVLLRLRTLAQTEKLPDGAPDPECIDAGFQWLLDSNSWDLLIHADGNVELPLAERQFVEEAQEASARNPRYLGPFECLYLGSRAAKAQGADRPVDRFIARCERQRRQVQLRLSNFDPGGVGRGYEASGVLPEAWAAGEWQEPQQDEAGASQAFNMFSASRWAARRDRASRGSLPTEVDQKLASKVARMAQRLDTEPDEPRRECHGKLKPGQRPLAFPERAGLGAARIFRYRFGRSSRR